MIHNKSGVLAATLLVTGCATGTSPPSTIGALSEDRSQDGFCGKRLLSEHFEILSTIHDGEFEAALPGFLEAVYLQCTATLSATSSDRARLQVYVFGTRAEWERFVRARFPTRYDVYARIQSGGFTERSTCVTFHVSRAGTLATLAHEAWHQYVGANVKTATPAWLNEGLACLFESVHSKGSGFDFTPRENDFRVNSLRQGIQMGDLIPLSRLIETDAGEVISGGQSKTTQTYYAQAWALVTFLRYGAGGRFAKAFDRMLSDIAENKFHVRFSAACITAPARPTVGPQAAVFEAYFGVLPEEIAGEYHEYIARVAGF